MTEEEDDDEREGRDEEKALGCRGERQAGRRVKLPAKTITNPSFQLLLQLPSLVFFHCH